MATTLLTSPAAEAQVPPDARTGRVATFNSGFTMADDDGRAVDALADIGNRWGATKDQVQYTWRSGLGVDAVGNLRYVGGANLNLVTLARALVQAGAVRGMPLLPDGPGSIDQRDFVAVVLR